MTNDEIITISLGGSIINPGSIDKEFVQNFASLIQNNLQEFSNRRFVIICGGGRVARDYIKETPSNLPSGQKDLLGIMPTWVNAQLLTAWFHGYTPSIPSQEFYQFVKQISSYRVLIGGGFLPGIKTDEDAAICADYFGSPLLINITNVDGVYDVDPRTNVEAKKIPHLSYAEFYQLIGGTDVGPGASAPFTLIAAKIAERSNCRILIVNKDIDSIGGVLRGENRGTEISNFPPST
ncbi:MAG: UMP kinase [Candidatus Hodarchaeales archaeon]